MLVRLDHVSCIIVNADDGIVRSTEKLRVFNGVIRLGVPQPRMAAQRKSDRRRNDLYVAGLRKRAQNASMSSGW